VRDRLFQALNEALRNSRHIQLTHESDGHDRAVSRRW
jgi:hypothetical protein